MCNSSQRTHTRDAAQAHVYMKTLVFVSVHVYTQCHTCSVQVEMGLFLLATYQ